MRIYIEEFAQPTRPPGEQTPEHMPAPPPVDPEAAFKKAREHLTRNGVATHEAEENLGLVLAAIAQSRQPSSEAEDTGSGPPADG